MTTLRLCLLPLVGEGLDLDDFLANPEASWAASNIKENEASLISGPIILRQTRGCSPAPGVFVLDGPLGGAFVEPRPLGVLEALGGAAGRDALALHSGENKARSEQSHPLLLFSKVQLCGAAHR